MQPTARAHWNPIKTDEPVPVIGVVPVIASTVRQAIKVDSLHRIESEPWKIALGKIHSYRVCGLAYNELDGLLTIDGSARYGAPAELHPDVAHLLERSDQVRVGFSDIHGRAYSSPIRVNEREVRWGSCEVSATYGGPLVNSDGDRRTSFVAVASTYHSMPYFIVDLLWHNADWEHVVGDIYHTGLELDLPPGFHAVELHPLLAPDSGDWDILPMQGGRLRRWLVARIGQTWNPPAMLELDSDCDRISWANPICQGYLPQGVPIEADRARADHRSSEIILAGLSGDPLDDWSQGEVNGWQAEGTPYGAATSSEGVEYLGEYGLALHGHADALRTMQAATFNRLPALLLDKVGEPMNAEAYADSLDRLPFRLRIDPMGRGVEGHRAGRVLNWKPGRDAFGFRTAPTTDEDRAIELGIHPEHRTALYSFGPYDRQHWMRAIRATLPLAYICGDRLSVHLLREHAATARAEFWEGNGSSEYDNRVGHLWDTVRAQPQVGAEIGREDVWAIQTVLAACELSRGIEGVRFGRWLARYSVAMAGAQWNYTTGGEVRPGLIQARRSGKEIVFPEGDFAVNQGYQESMLAWSALGLARHFRNEHGCTSADQARAVRLFHGERPAYRIGVIDLDTGDLLTDKAQQLAHPFPVDAQVQSSYVPTLAAMALMLDWMKPPARSEMLEWLAVTLNCSSTAALSEWRPADAAEERQSGCVAPVLEWLRRHGMLLG